MSYGVLESIRRTSDGLGFDFHHRQMPSRTTSSMNAACLEFSLFAGKDFLFPNLVNAVPIICSEECCYPVPSLGANGVAFKLRSGPISLR